MKQVEQSSQSGSMFEQLAAWLLPDNSPSNNAPMEPDCVTSICRAGLAGLALSARPAKRFPDGQRRMLIASAAQTGAENLQAMNELARVAAALDAERIPVLLLKGAALSLTVYPSLDLRPMSDLDLLVAPDDAKRALRVLETIGYARGAAQLREDFFPDLYYETELFLPGSQPVRIDLHAHPFRPMHLAQTISTSSFWNGAVALPIQNSVVHVPSSETMFIHLAAHAAFHGCNRLIWLIDLKRFVEHDDAQLDWNVIARRAREWRLSLAVQTALTVAEETLGPICPAGFLSNLCAQPKTWRERLTLWHTPRDAAAPWLHVLCNLACIQGFDARRKYVAALLVPDQGHLAGLYGKRHFGWTACAQLIRTGRAFLRALSMPIFAIRNLIRSANRSPLPC